MLTVSALDGMRMSVAIESTSPGIIVTGYVYRKILRIEPKTKKGLGQVDKYGMIVRNKRIDTMCYNKIHILTSNN